MKKKTKKNETKCGICDFLELKENRCVQFAEKKNELTKLSQKTKNMYSESIERLNNATHFQVIGQRKTI